MSRRTPFQVAVRRLQHAQRQGWIRSFDLKPRPEPGEPSRIPFTVHFNVGESTECSIHGVLMLVRGVRTGIAIAREGKTDDGTEPTDDCTGVAAVWCPIHGDCRCERVPSEWDGVGKVRATSPTLNDEACPLHSPESDHGDNAFRPGIAASGGNLPAEVVAPQSVWATPEDRDRFAAWLAAPEPGMTFQESQPWLGGLLDGPVIWIEDPNTGDGDWVTPDNPAESKILKGGELYAAYVQRAFRNGMRPMEFRNWVATAMVVDGEWRTTPGSTA